MHSYNSLINKKVTGEMILTSLLVDDWIEKRWVQAIVEADVADEFPELSKKECSKLHKSWLHIIFSLCACLTQLVGQQGETPSTRFQCTSFFNMEAFWRRFIFVEAFLWRRFFLEAFLFYLEAFAIATLTMEAGI
jgi:hypothetical protein